jgi:hypothetical protein
VWQHGKLFLPWPLTSLFRQYPWSYYTSLNSENALNESSPVNCLIKPDTCLEENYYRGGTKVNDVKLYDQYGYIDSGSSSGISVNPFYSKP